MSICRTSHTSDAIWPRNTSLPPIKITRYKTLDKLLIIILSTNNIGYPTPHSIDTVTIASMTESPNHCSPVMESNHTRRILSFVRVVPFSPLLGGRSALHPWCNNFTITTEASIVWVFRSPDSAPRCNYFIGTEL